MSALVLDTAKSRIQIRTFAQGLLARLAHDLELTCGGVTGSGERSGPEAGSARLEIPIARIEVAGTLKGDRVDPGGLSASDRNDCLAKMHDDVFHTRRGTTDVVRVEARLESSRRARVRVVPPNGRAVERDIEVTIAEEASAGARVAGRCNVSLDATGARPVKGPMNAFRVKDAVEILFDVVFVPAR